MAQKKSLLRGSFLCVREGLSLPERFLFFRCESEINVLLNCAGVRNGAEVEAHVLLACARSGKVAAILAEVVE